MGVPGAATVAPVAAAGSASAGESETADGFEEVVLVAEIASPSGGSPTGQKGLPRRPRAPKGAAVSPAAHDVASASPSAEAGPKRLWPLGLTPAMHYC